MYGDVEIRMIVICVENMLGVTKESSARRESLRRFVEVEKKTESGVGRRLDVYQ